MNAYIIGQLSHLLRQVTEVKLTKFRRQHWPGLPVPVELSSPLQSIAHSPQRGMLQPELVRENVKKSDP